MPDFERTYHIMQNGKGELFFTLQTRKGEPESPRILYAGEEHALFYRNGGEAVILDFIHPKAREPLANADFATIIEAGPEGIERQYTVPVRHLQALAFPRQLYARTESDTNRIDAHRPGD